MKYYIKKAFGPLYYFFKPQQRWLTSQYRKTWMDKDEIIFTTLFGCIVHYVEVEAKDDREISYDEDLAAGFVTQEYVEHRKKIQDKITEIYLWHTHDRKLLEDQIDDCMNYAFDSFLDLNSLNDLKARSKRQKTYKKIQKLRDRLEKRDKDYMKQIVELSGYLWT
jgi:hypothetical protein